VVCIANKRKNKMQNLKSSCDNCGTPKEQYVMSQCPNCGYVGKLSQGKGAQNG
jgi:predicted RNA-binding Zn-ribbon protein involved in translation (DUF1610 family)